MSSIARAWASVSLLIQADPPTSPACTEKEMKWHGRLRPSTTPQRDPRSHAGQPTDVPNAFEPTLLVLGKSLAALQSEAVVASAFSKAEKDPEEESCNPSSCRPAHPQPLHGSSPPVSHVAASLLSCSADTASFPGHFEVQRQQHLHSSLARDPQYYFPVHPAAARRDCAGAELWLLTAVDHFHLTQVVLKSLRSFFFLLSVAPHLHQKEQDLRHLQVVSSCHWRYLRRRPSCAAVALSLSVARTHLEPDVQCEHNPRWTVTGYGTNATYRESHSHAGRPEDSSILLPA